MNFFEVMQQTLLNNFQQLNFVYTSLHSFHKALLFLVYYYLFIVFFFFSLFIIYGHVRKKRSLSDWLIAPNTKWCGRGQVAGRYNELGGASKADKCCRRHDHCKLNIQSLSTKWHLFNYRPFTISHCSCDMRLAKKKTIKKT